jgi:LysM repeat protein
MKRLLILLFAIPLLSSAQEKLFVQGTSPDLYLNHIVAPKEGFYKIARTYNVNPQKLAAYNGIDYDKGPNVGANVKIPLTEDNFSQDDKTGSDETLIPLYHVVAEKEGLYHISVMYNKVPKTLLEKWNNLQGEAINKGSSFIVGYLKVKKSLSTITAASPDNTDAASAPVKEIPVVTTPAPVKKVTPPPAPVVVETPVKETPKPATAVVKQAPVTQQPDVDITPETPVTTDANANLSEGAFKTDYIRQTNKISASTENGAGGAFKSSSGWVDGKYYCLQNNARSGTIVKITNTDNGKTIYAKVLEPMPDIAQNSDMIILVSNAGAEALGAGKDGKFNCTLEYSK